jgi:hypothetical protein
MSGPDRDPPPPDPSDPGPAASNVVPIAQGKRRPATPKPVTAVLPEHTGVGSMQGDPLLANLRESCLTDDTINAARLFTVPSSKWRAYGFRSAARAQSGLMLPFFEPDATEPYEFRLKPQYPIPVPSRKAGGKTKLKKYDQRGGAGVSLVYTPPLPPTLERRYDIMQPLVWTEGEKKALLLAQLGHCVVGLTGVDMWHDLQAKARDEGYRLHPHIIKRYAIEGRAHIIVFDADARSPLKPGIMLAARKLAGVLIRMGAISVHLCLPPESGEAKGIDDYAYKHGLDACAQLLASIRMPLDDIDPDAGALPLAQYAEWYEGSAAEHLCMPRGYETDRDGSLWHTDDATRPDERTLISVAPIVITRIFEVLQAGGERHEIRFRDARGRWRAVVVPREVTGSTREIVAALRPHGALINASTAMGVTKYLDAFERDNGALIERALCVAQTGWHQGQFVMGGAPLMASPTAQPIRLDGSPELQRIAAAVQPARGAELAAHLEALAVPIAASTECALAVYAALSAPLLHVLDVGNFAVHLSGDSSRGKTSMLRIAASVFGDPRSANWVASWNATLAGLEQRATLLNDLPQCYDEVGVADPELIRSMVYTLVNGEGRTRSTKEATVRFTPRWRTVVLSTGEPEIVTERDPTGAQARVINVPVLGFGGLGAAEIDVLVRECARHYGALGRAWLEALVHMTDVERAALRETYDAIAADIRRAADAAGNRVASRTAAYFAAMAVAETLLAARFGLGSTAAETVLTAVSHRNGDDEGRVKPLAERIVDELRDWIMSAPSAFPRKGDVSHLTTRVYGYDLGDGMYALVPSVLTDYLNSKSLPLTRAVRTELIASGALHPESGRTTARVFVGGKQHRLLVFKL